MAYRPRLLDLCCKAGGAAMGYHRAGFDVVGVDMEPQPHYPFRFIQGDALTISLVGYDVYHVSPPCQQFSRCKAMRRQEQRIYPDLVDALRQRVAATGKPYVIENVPGAPLRSPIMLCGQMFGLKVLRHRWFESNVLLLSPGPCSHVGLQWRRDFYTVAGHMSGKAQWGAAMGIDWMIAAELAQAVPPAYTEYVGRQVMVAVMGRCA